MAVLAGVLLVLDLFVPDPIPLIDEVLLAVLTLLLAQRGRGTTPTTTNDAD